MTVFPEWTVASHKWHKAMPALILFIRSTMTDLSLLTWIVPFPPLKNHGWLFIPDGARRAGSRISSIPFILVVFEIGSLLKSEMPRWTSSAGGPKASNVTNSSL